MSLLFLFFALSLSLTSFGPEPNTVKILDSGFYPNTIEIKEGEMVKFENLDDEAHRPASDNHPTHSIYNGFDPISPIKPDENWQFTFQKIGRWSYHDHLKPQNVGFINVNPKDHKTTIRVRLAEYIGYVDFLLNSLNLNIFSFNSVPSVKSIESIPKNIDIDEIYSKLSFRCDKEDLSCILLTTNDLTAEYGPGPTLEILKLLESDGKIGNTINTHYVAHTVGEKTAKTFGESQDAFLLCPMNEYNGGCEHGFFEYVTARVGSAQEAAARICDSFGDKNYSDKFMVYCYHGIGHGVMMSEAYDLEKSLQVCDKLPGKDGKKGCWQGVFMENVLANANGNVPSEYLSSSDKFAPCNWVEEKYKWECYINHSGYLMSLFNGSMEKTAEACAESPEYSDVCAQGLGLYVSNPTWIFKTTGITDPEEAARKGAEICDSFPPSIIEDCFAGTIGSILNNDWPDIHRRATKVCEQAINLSTASCYGIIGNEMKKQLSGTESIKDACNSVPEIYRMYCIDG